MINIKKHTKFTEELFRDENGFLTPENERYIRIKTEFKIDRYSLIPRNNHEDLQQKINYAQDKDLHVISNMIYGSIRCELVKVLQMSYRHNDSYLHEGIKDIINMIDGEK